MNNRKSYLCINNNYITNFVIVIFLVYPFCLSLGTTISILKLIGIILYFSFIAIFVFKSLLHLKIINDGNSRSLFIFCLFYTISILFYSITTPFQFWILKDLLYSVFPCIVYLLFRATNHKINYNQIYCIIIYCTIISDIIALLMYFSPQYISYFYTDFENTEFTFYKLFGPFGLIITGYTNIIALCIIVFGNVTNKRLISIGLIILFTSCSILTTQRSPMFGLFVVLSLFLLKKRINSIIPILIFIMAIIIAFNYISNYLSIEDITSTFQNKWTLQNMSDTRSEQLVIYNKENFFFLLFGEGVGKYSPENPFAQHVLPDGMYFRLYNEMGLIGIFLYLYFVTTIINKAIKEKDYLVLSIAIYSFFATGFNRVMFICPFSIMSYIIMSSLYVPNRHLNNFKYNKNIEFNDHLLT